MRVTFTKLAQRGYRIDAVSAAHHWELPKAPGWDADLPHDLAHFLAERVEGIGLGIFGQLAAGGSAGTFRDGVPSATQKKRSDRLGRAGRADVARSERLAAGIRGFWSQHAGRPDTPGLPVELVTPALASAVVETAQRWRSLPEGGSLEFDWPAGPAVRTRTSTATGRRRSVQ